MTRQEIKAKAREMLGGGIFQNAWLVALLICLIASLLTSLGSFVAIGSLILMGPLYVGLSGSFLKRARGGEMAVEDCFDGFKNDFAGNFLIGLMISIFTTLWSFLFIIPGIIKSLSYSMAFYIKNDHPEYDWRQCIDESKKMMNGHKMELFILQLSFIGWIFVGALACGIGTLWVAPYMEAARTQFYLSIKGDDETVFDQPDAFFEA